MLFFQQACRFAFLLLALFHQRIELAAQRRALGAELLFLLLQLRKTQAACVGFQRLIRLHGRVFGRAAQRAGAAGLQARALLNEARDTLFQIAHRFRPGHVFLFGFVSLTLLRQQLFGVLNLRLQRAVRLLQARFTARQGRKG